MRFSFIPRRVPSAAIPVVRSSRFGHDYALGLGRAPATNTLPRASSNFRSPFRLGDPESIQPDSDRAAPLLVCAPVGSFGAARAGGAMQQFAAQLKQMPVGDVQPKLFEEEATLRRKQSGIATADVVLSTHIGDNASIFPT